MEQTTRLVVGAPFVIDLGVPVGARSASVGTPSLRIDQPVSPTPATITLPSLLSTNGKNPALVIKRRYVVVGFAAFLALIGFFWAVGRGMYEPSSPKASMLRLPELAGSELPPPLPVASYPTTAVAQVDRPYSTQDMPLPVLPPASALDFKPATSLPEAPLPETPAAKETVRQSAPQPKAPIASATPLPQSKPVDTNAGRASAPTKDKSAPTVPTAVVMNEDAVSDSSAKPVAAKKPAVEAPPKPQAPKAPASPLRLIAIAPDGKSAAFSDPATKLPIQYKTGQRLPNGETIMQINASAGKIVTSSKEYTLD